MHIRIFSHPQRSKEHSYYVGYEAGGLSERLELLPVNPANTFLQLRQHIEEQSDGNIIRRRPFFTEFWHFMQRCPNPLGYEGEDLMTYRIGMLEIKDEKSFVPSMKYINLIKEDVEECSISQVVDSLLDCDIVLIPTTQIHPMNGHLSDRL